MRYTWLLCDAIEGDLRERVAHVSEFLLGAIEAGGTKFLCAVGYSPERVLESAVVPTVEPDATLTAVLDFFSAHQKKHGPIRAFGIASFGPLDLRRGSPTCGRLMATPKPHWSGIDLVGTFSTSVPDVARCFSSVMLIAFRTICGEVGRNDSATEVSPCPRRPVEPVY